MRILKTVSALLIFSGAIFIVKLVVEKTLIKSEDDKSSSVKITVPVSSGNNSSSSSNNNIVNRNFEHPEDKKKKVEALSFEIEKVSLTDANTVVLVDEVTEESSTLVIKKLSTLDTKMNSSPIYLVLYSPGGSVMAGAQILNAIEASKRPVYTLCVKICASMAAIIHSYGTKRLMLDRSILMHHNESSEVRGSVPSMLNMLNMLSRYIDEMELNVANRAGLKLGDYKNLIANELWLSSREALQEHFADSIVYSTEYSDDVENVLNSKIKLMDKKFILDWK